MFEEEKTVLKAAMLIERISVGVWDGARAIVHLAADGVSEVDAIAAIETAAERLEEFTERIGGKK